MAKWVRERRIRWKETIGEEIENVPKGFLGLFKGKTFGKCW